MKQSSLWYLISVIIFYSCNNKNSTNLAPAFPLTFKFDISSAVTDSLNLSEIAEKIEYIPLESKNNSTLGYFEDYYVTDEYIFIKNGLSIFVFNLNGYFIRSLFNEGKGPGEAFTGKFAVDEKNRKVYVYDNKIKNVKIYGYSGEYFGTIYKPITPPDHWIYSIGYFKNNLFVHTAQRLVSGTFIHALT